MKEWIAHLIGWYQQTLDSAGYPLIAGLMLMESTIVPLPSEMVIPFAAHQAARRTGRSRIGTSCSRGQSAPGLGPRSCIGERDSRDARWLFVTVAISSYPKRNMGLPAERWLAQFGSFGVFAARLLPVVRHLIGIPMGIVKMDFPCAIQCSRWRGHVFLVRGAGVGWELLLETTLEPCSRKA